MLDSENWKDVPFSFPGENWNFGSLNSVVDAGAAESADKTQHGHFRKCTQLNMYKKHISKVSHTI